MNNAECLSAEGKDVNANTLQDLHEITTRRVQLTTLTKTMCVRSATRHMLIQRVQQTIADKCTGVMSTNVNSARKLFNIVVCLKTKMGHGINLGQSVHVSQK